jgi:hypothetical protein
MSKNPAAYWICRNRGCGASEVVRGTESQRESKRCLCGSAMLKGKLPVVFTYLDFLREETGSFREIVEEQEPCES